MYVSVKVWEAAVDIAIKNKQELYGEVVGVVSHPDNSNPKVDDFFCKCVLL